MRILASLAIKKTTQSHIVSKLSSCKKIDSTLKALIAFDEIIMTDYMLDYIDSKETNRKNMIVEGCKGSLRSRISAILNGLEPGLLFAINSSQKHR